jgi:hypothetical protein
MLSLTFCGKQEGEQMAGGIDWICAHGGGKVIHACAIHNDAKSDAELTKSQPPSKSADAYALPKCCIEALNTRNMRGLLIAAIGAAVATKSLMDDVIADPHNLTDVYQKVTIDWDKEAQTQAELYTGIAGLQSISIFSVVEKHYWHHASEPNSDACRFWTRLYRSARSKLPAAVRGQKEAYDSIE